MFNLQISFERPWYLLLLVLLPLLWLFSYRSLSGLGSWRRATALTLRSLVVLLFVAALAEIQLVRVSDRLTVIYLLDQSESIPVAKRQAMMHYVAREVSLHRRRKKGKEDLAGVIVFGADAKVEVPPFDDDIYSSGMIETYMELQTDATNLASALKLAQASFPHNASKRIVIVTDGNETLGDARMTAQSLAREGIGIDVVPVQLTVRAEVAVEKITLPPDIQEEQPFETRVVIHNFSRATAENPQGTVSGTLTVKRFLGRDEELLLEEKLTLKPGKNVIPFTDTIKRVGAYTYRADFDPDDRRDDAIARNNRATAFSHVRGKGSVLLIEDWDHPGEFKALVDSLRKNGFEVHEQRSDELFTSLAELQAYDTVILANVPRTSGDDAKSVSHFSDEQIRMLVRNTEQMGAGLIMLGGPNSLGAGGWANTELEKAMPVDFQIKNRRIQAVGALAMIMHASEMPQGNHWQKVIGREALKTLGPMDYCGVVYWSNRTSGDAWLWGNPPGLMRVGGQQKTMVAKLGRMVPGDMPLFDGGMQLALKGLKKVNASIKHLIIISDGDPAQPMPGTTAAFTAANIKISTVAVGAHGTTGHRTLQKIASDTGGKYYVVRNPKALPKIYQREARRVARPLIFEPEGGVGVNVEQPTHDILQGIDRDSLPPISAYVLSTKKDNPLVEQLITADKPQEQANATVLAAWTYGLGRSVVFSTDAGHRWAQDWPDSANYEKLFTQMVRWSMGAGMAEETTDEGKFTVVTDFKDGKVRVVVTALNKDDEFLNFLKMSGSAVGPDLKPFEVQIRQIAPGRYVGEFKADKAGSYLINVKPDQQAGSIKAGIAVPYSDEFRIRQTNFQLLSDLAGLLPRKGEAGKVLEGSIVGSEVEQLLAVDTFRRSLAKAVSSQDFWPAVLVAAAMLFLADVFVRRVTIGMGWLLLPFAWLRDRLILRREEAETFERLARLRNQKEAVGDQIEQRRAATRFEPQADAPPPDVDPAQLLDQPDAGRQPDLQDQRRAEIAPGEVEEESYTSRLLKAKQQALKNKKKQ